MYLYGTNIRDSITSCRHIPPTLDAIHTRRWADTEMSYQQVVRHFQCYADCMQDEYTLKYTATDINYWFGDHKTYREGRDMYWAIMSKYNWSPARTDCPPISLTEYAYWYPFHMLMQEKFCPLLTHER